MQRNFVPQDVVEQYQRDGVVVLKQALKPGWLELIELGLNRNIKNPGPSCYQMWIDTSGPSGEFLARPGDYVQDFCNYEAIPEYRRLLRESPIAGIAARLMQSRNVWLYFDQIFLKQGPSRRTPWHQDTPYQMLDGRQMCTVWIPTRDLHEDEAMEFVLGTHRGPTYDGFKYTAESEQDFTDPYYGGGHFPRLPDIESERDRWPIKACPMERGDVLVFHNSTLHGGGAVREGAQRRAFSVRLFGDDTRFVERPGVTGPVFPCVADDWKHGDLPRHPIFPLVFPYPRSNPRGDEQPAPAVPFGSAEWYTMVEEEVRAVVDRHPMEQDGTFSVVQRFANPPAGSFVPQEGEPGFVLRIAGGNVYLRPGVRPDDAGDLEITADWSAVHQLRKLPKGAEYDRTAADVAARGAVIVKGSAPPCFDGLHDAIARRTM